jgi:hypothetical protein
MASPFASAQHQQALSWPTGYRRFTQCTFTRNGVSEVLEPINGSFTQDARRSGRWDGRLAFAGIDAFPRRPGDLLTPFGTLVRVELGLELLDGTVSTVPYGTFEVSSAGTGRSPGQRTVNVSLIDLSDRVDRYRFERPFEPTNGTWFSRVVNEVLLNRTGISPNLPNGSVIFNNARIMGLESGTGPWDELQDMAEALGVKIWYDRSGEIQIGAITSDPENAYALTGTVSISADFDTRPANVVVVRGEDQEGTPPVQAIAMDTDPGSPTYAGTAPGTSPYGRTTSFYSSPLIKTTAQAQAAANASLAAGIGAGASYTITWPYNPTVDAGDVVSIGGDTFAIDAITVDLTGETTAKAREIR